MSRLVVYRPESDRLDIQPSRDWMPSITDLLWQPLGLADWDLFAGDNLQVDLYETNQDLVVKASLPGVDLDDVSIEEQQGMLTIKAVTQFDKEDNSEGWLLHERRWGAWQRSLRLPVDVKSEKAKAELVNGVLTITLPKANPEQTMVNRIKVNLPKISLPRIAGKENKIKIQQK